MPATAPNCIFLLILGLWIKLKCFVPPWVWAPYSPISYYHVSIWYSTKNIYTLNEWKWMNENYTETQCEKYHICSFNSITLKLLSFQRNTVFLGTTHLEICNIFLNTYHCLKGVSLLRLCSPLTSLHHYLWPIFHQLTLDPGDPTNPGCRDTQLKLLCNTLITPRHQRPTFDYVLAQSVLFTVLVQTDTCFYSSQ